MLSLNGRGFRKPCQSLDTLGYSLELEHGVVLSIQVMSERHYEELRLFGSQFFKAVEREGVSV